jgi:hypothetical protein
MGCFSDRRRQLRHDSYRGKERRNMKNPCRGYCNSSNTLKVQYPCATEIIIQCHVMLHIIFKPISYEKHETTETR